MMYLKRTCPPPSVLLKGGELAERHLRSCRWCREEMEHTLEYAKAGQLIYEAALRSGFKRSEPTQPAAGEIRAVKPGVPETDFYDEYGIYHNPPLVLVLNEPDEAGFVTVAQVFDEEDLCDAGDVTVDEGLFAEAWNVYGLPASALARHAFCRLGGEAVEKVLAASAGEFPDIEESSPLYWFRQCELETGSFFSLRLNAEALARLEAQERRAAPRDLSAAFRRIIGHWQQGREWDRHPVACAAAGDLLGPHDDRAAEVLRVTCLCAVVSDSGDETAPMPLEAEVHAFPRSHACQAFFRPPAGMRVEEALAGCAGAEVRVSAIEPYHGDVWTLWMEIAGDMPDLSALRIALRLASEGDS